MRLVDHAVTKPSRCAVLPYIGADHPRGYIDTGSEMPGIATNDHVYVSVVAVEEMARLIGWFSPDDMSQAGSQIADLQDQVALLTQERDQAVEQVHAIDVIESADFRARKKTGRPRKETVNG